MVYADDRISTGKVVTIRYVLRDESDREILRSTEDSPLVYLHGAGNVVPGLEVRLEGLAPGQSADVHVSPNEGFGEWLPERLGVLSRSEFPDDLELEVGMEFSSRDGLGREGVVRIVQLQGDRVLVDGNHPLAGRAIRFQVMVRDVRLATSEEIASGTALPVFPRRASVPPMQEP